MYVSACQLIVVVVREDTARARWQLAIVSARCRFAGGVQKLNVARWFMMLTSTAYVAGGVVVSLVLRELAKN